MARGPGSPLPFARYDRRSYPTLSVEEGYAAWSPVYGDLDDRFDIDLLEGSAVVGPSTPGRSLVDLACGNGRIGAWLATRGATRVAGVDRTMAMLSGARARGCYGALVRARIEATPLEAGAFDGATCSMALCHVRDLGAFFGEARRLLRPGGWLAIVDYHPAFLMRGIPTHFHRPETGAPVAIENHVHALRDFFGAAQRAGLRTREMQERYIDEEWVQAHPGYRPHEGWPVTHLWVYEAT